MVRLHVGHQQPQFWLILVRLVHYYSPFWGARAIYTIADPGVRLLVCYQHSQLCPIILVRLVDYYSPFWGPRAISTIEDPRGCVYVPIINTHSSGQF